MEKRLQQQQQEEDLAKKRKKIDEDSPTKKQKIDSPEEGPVEVKGGPYMPGPEECALCRDTGDLLLCDGPCDRGVMVFCSGRAVRFFIKLFLNSSKPTPNKFFRFFW